MPDELRLGRIRGTFAFDLSLFARPKPQQKHPDRPPHITHDRVQSNQHINSVSTPPCYVMAAIDTTKWCVKSPFAWLDRPKE